MADISQFIRTYISCIGKGKTLFNLEKYKHQGLIKEVFTDNVDFFTKQFRKQFQKELIC